MLAVALHEHGPPRLDAIAMSISKQRVHSPGASYESVRKGAAYLCLSTVSVDEGAQRLRRHMRIHGRFIQREGLRGVRQVPQPRTRCSTIPVDEYPAITHKKIPGREISVAHQVRRGRWYEGWSESKLRRVESVARVMDPPDYSSDSCELRMSQGRPVDGENTVDELSHHPSSTVAPHRCRHVYPTLT